ncbi:MAG TPA: hypothetical protein VMM77_07900 [Gemmatimonadaceae bacterium]|nr:hypothetical protein [Gemmatimonadaceae bacterium]
MGCDDGAYADLETASSPATGEVVPIMDLDVEEVRLGRAMGADMRIVDEADGFAPNDSVHAAVKTSGVANSATLTARWTTESDSVLHEEMKTVSSNGEQWTTFSFAGRSLAEGDYALKILVNGREVEEREFSIERP